MKPARARPLVLIEQSEIDRGNSIYVAGGFNAHPLTHQPFIVADLQVFKEKDKTWTRLTTIPHLELLHVLSFHSNKLYVSESIEANNQTPTINVLRNFDLKTLTWKEGDGSKS